MSSTTHLSHAEELTAALQAAWQEPGAGNPGYGSRLLKPIAHTDQDQPTPAGAQNPLWDVVRWMPASPPLFGGGLLEPEAYTAGLGGLKHLDALGAGRRNLATRYSWSIITPGDVTWMAGILDGRKVVEIGAGTGYWAWQLEQAGVDAAAYDPHPAAPDNEYCKHGPYTTVLPGGAEAVAAHPGRALLMVWPPYEGKHAEEALRAYRGDMLIYAGGAWGCTANGAFYELLDAEWAELSTAPQHVTWAGIHCSLTAYRRASKEA